MLIVFFRGYLSIPIIIGAVALLLSVFSLSNDEDNSTDPQIAAVGNNVYIAWLNHDADDFHQILLKRSTNEGASFGSVKILSDVSEEFLVDK